ncbi:hypothetical protein C9994_09750, partial [Marivirga lumbricoides]
DTEIATPTSGTLGTFNDGTSYEVVATVTDAASNSASDATSNEVSIDTTAPATPTVNALTTSDNTPTLSGTAEIGSTVVVVINGVTFTTTADASGDWSVDTETATPTAGGPFTPLPDGDYDVAVTSTDAAGNSSSDATNNELTINTSIPTAPTVNLLTTNDVTPVITGTNGLGTSQPAGETLTVTVNGATYTVTPDASGNWSVDTETATPTSGTLGTFNDGTSYEVVATVTDAASNTASDATSNEVSIDNTAPATPTVNALTTSDNTPVLSGTAEIGSTVVVVINGVTFTTTADASGNWSVDTETATPTAGGPFTPLTDGDYDVAVTSTDAAGNSSSDATTNELTVNTSSLTVPTVNILSNTDGLPILTGTWDEANATSLEVMINGVTYVLGTDAELTTDGSGNWTLDLSGLTTPLTNGTYDVAVSTSDGTDTVTDATTDELTVAITSMSLPTVNILSSTDGLPILTGTWDEANATSLEVTVNGVTYVLGTDAELTTDGSGNWTLDLSGLTTPLTNGTYDVEVSTSDGTDTVTDATMDELTVNIILISADIGVRKSVSNGPYLVGNIITYKIIVENFGPGTASNIVVTDELSLDLRYVASTASRGEFNNISGEWRIENLEIGKADSLLIEVEILSEGVIDNEAEGYAEEVDPDLSNNLSELISINANEAFEISAGFSPDGDGINDTWTIKGIANYPNNNVQIYNRWGNLVFEVKSYNNQDKAWKGEVKSKLVVSGNEVPDGTYFYLIDLGDGSKPMNGYITLMR